MTTMGKQAAKDILERQRARETANVTRPDFDLDAYRRVTECVEALIGIRNPSAIPALIVAARKVAATYIGHTDMLRDELAALDAEPVA